MSTTYSFGVSNTTASSATVAPIKLGLVSNYGKTIDEPNMSRMTNSGTALSQDEYVTFKSRRIKSVDADIPVYNPAGLKDSVLYSSDIQLSLRETRDDGTVIDHPIEAWITVKHDIAAPWTEVPALGTSYVYQVVQRLLGTLFHDDGTERFKDLAKSALVPTSD